MNLLEGQYFGHYHIIEQIGEGGMATVYKAYDVRLERDVALKVILPNRWWSPKFIKRFEREAKALSKLKHPSIVKILDYGQHEGMPYLVMEYVPGGNLKERLDKPIPWREAAGLLIPIANALAYAHDMKVLHRDVKPSNILLAESGQPMLSDFGVAKILEEDETIDLTGTGVGVGTPEYMAPEQGMGSEVDQRVDIYSLGVVFYELVTGRTPFKADTPLAVLMKHVNEPLPRPGEIVEDLPKSVERVLIKALAKKPEDRYVNMELFAQTLEKLAVLALKKPQVPPSGLKWRRFGWAFIGIVGASVIIVLSIITAGELRIPFGENDELSSMKATQIPLTSNYTASSLVNTVTPIPKYTTTSSPKPIQTPTIIVSPTPSQSEFVWHQVDLLPILEASKGSYVGEAFVIDNMQNEDWYGMDCAPISLKDQFKVTLSMEGQGGAAISLSGRINDPEKEWWEGVHRLYIHIDNGRIDVELRDGLDEYSQIFFTLPFSVRSNENITIWFRDPQGKTFEILDSEGNVVLESDVTKYLSTIWMPDGIFPERKLYVGVLMAPVSELRIHDLLMSVPITNTSSDYVDLTLYDNFNNSSYDGGYNDQLWEHWDSLQENELAVQQLNGVLKFNNSPQGDVMDRVLHTQDPSSWSLDEFNYFEADLKLGDDLSGESSFVKIQMSIGLREGLSEKTWLTQCGLNAQEGRYPNFFCDVITVIDNEYSNEYLLNQVAILYDTWYTIRISLDPESGELSYYLNGELIDRYVPLDAIELRDSKYSLFVGVWQSGNSSVSAWVDNVRIGLD